MIYFCDTLAFSHKNKREENQDTCGYLMGEGMLPNSKSKAAAFFVADGVSNSLGNVAAQRLRKGYRAVLAGLLDRCIALLEQQAQREAESLPAMDKAAFAWEIQELLRDTVLELDTLVRADSCVGTYGATVSLALVLDGNVYTANLGDSPIFLISLNSDDEPQSLRQLYQCQNEAADLPEEEALVSNLKNILSGPVLGDAPGATEEDPSPSHEVPGVVQGAAACQGQGGRSTF